MTSLTCRDSPYDAPRKTAWRRYFMTGLRIISRLLTGFFITWTLGAWSQAAPVGMPNPFISCRVESVSKLNDHVFEEGLGEYGNPSSDSDSEQIIIPSPLVAISTSVQVGQMSFRETDGHSLKVRVTNSSEIVDVKVKDGSYRLQIRYSRGSERGVVLYASGASKFQELATFDCSSVSLVESTEINNRNATRLSFEGTRRLAKKLRDRLDAVDFAVELGDGKYDLKEQRTYQVRDAGLQVVGYIVWARLHYTEDNEDIAAQVRFDRNGLRLSDEIERLGTCDQPLSASKSPKKK
jgi:hypothetical protein